MDHKQQLNDKLSKNRYIAEHPLKHSADPSSAPIVLATSASAAILQQLIKACPAGLYRQASTGEISFDANGCLECGTCRLLGDPPTFARWRYPAGACGIDLRFG